MGRWTGDETTEGATTGSDTADGPLYSSVSDRELLGITAEEITRLQRRQTTLAATERDQSAREQQRQQEQQEHQQERDGASLGPMDDGVVFIALVLLIALLLVMDGPGGQRGGVHG